MLFRCLQSGRQAGKKKNEMMSAQFKRKETGSEMTLSAALCTTCLSVCLYHSDIAAITDM